MPRARKIISLGSGLTSVGRFSGRGPDRTWQWGDTQTRIAGTRFSGRVAAFGVHSVSRLGPMRNVLLVLCLTCASTSTLSTPHPRRETISGRVVAYSSPLACLNGNGYWSMVIRVQESKYVRSDFIRVDFTLPCNKSPEWVSAKTSIQKFRLLRQNDCDAVLTEFMDTEAKQASAIPIWKLLSGAEQDTLPFGQVVPCYRSVDLPLAPAV